MYLRAAIRQASPTNGRGERRRIACYSLALCPNMPPWGFLANHTYSENPTLVVSESFFTQKTLALRKRPGIIAVEHLFESKYRDLDTAASIHQHF